MTQNLTCQLQQKASTLELRGLIQASTGYAVRETDKANKLIQPTTRPSHFLLVLFVAFCLEDPQLQPNRTAAPSYYESPWVSVWQQRKLICKRSPCLSIII